MSLSVAGPGAGDVGGGDRHRHTRTSGCRCCSNIRPGESRNRSGEVTDIPWPGIGMADGAGLGAVSPFRVYTVAVRLRAASGRGLVAAGTGSDRDVGRVGDMAAGTGLSHRSGPAASGVAHAAGRGGDAAGCMTPGAVIPVDTLPRTGGWVGGQVVMAALAAVAACGIDADIEARVDVAGGAVAGLAVGEIALCRRAVGCADQVAAVQRMGRSAAAGTEIAEPDRQGRVGQLVGGIVAVTPGVIAAEVGLVVPRAGAAGTVHADVAVPVVAGRIGVRVEQGVSRCR